MYLDQEGISYFDIADFILTGCFDFCACGSPMEAIKFIKEGLEYIDWRSQEIKAYSGEQYKEAWARIKEQEGVKFASLGGATFFYYWATNENLIEHGGSVPGWLTPKGEKVINLCKAALEIENENQH